MNLLDKIREYIFGDYKVSEKAVVVIDSSGEKFTKSSLTKVEGMATLTLNLRGFSLFKGNIKKNLRKVFGKSNRFYFGKEEEYDIWIIHFRENVYEVWSSDSSVKFRAMNNNGSHYFFLDALHKLIS
jgi:hypothetical protein